MNNKIKNQKYGISYRKTDGIRWYRYKFIGKFWTTEDYFKAEREMDSLREYHKNRVYKVIKIK